MTGAAKPSEPEPEPKPKADTRTVFLHTFNEDQSAGLEMFDDALRGLAFKAHLPTVVKDKTNSQYKSKYASEDALINTINPELSKHGLSATFDFAQTGDEIKVTCNITHADGHRESVSLSGKADGSGSKNPLQQIKSTTTYLRKATFEAITGIASSDNEADDDGNGASRYLTEAEVVTIISIVTDKQVDLKKFLAYMKAESIETILESDYQKAIQALKVAKGDKK